jgi:uncharacterized DUF497 family protein
LLKIEGIIWFEEIIDKITRKHRVLPEEVEELLHNRPQIRFLEKGRRKGEDLYVALGQTDTGRFLAVVLVYKPNSHEVLILSARDMARKERKLYERKKNI